jgi:hypothetical protein
MVASDSGFSGAMTVGITDTAGLTYTQQAVAGGTVGNYYAAVWTAEVPGPPPSAGSATLAGAGTLTAAAEETIPAGAAMSGGGTLVATPLGVTGGTAALTGSGTLGAAGIQQATAVLAGQGTLTAVVPITFPSAAALTGTSALYTGAETAPAVFPPPTVPVFIAGYQPLQADFTGWWYDVLGFHQNRPVFRAEQATTTTTIPGDGANFPIGFDTVLEDPYDGWGLVTANAWSPPAGYSGWYQVTVTAYVHDLPSAGSVRATIGGTYTQDLGTTAGPTSHYAGVEGQFVVYLIGGQDTVWGGVELFASSSGSTSDTAGQLSTMEILWLSD